MADGDGVFTQPQVYFHIIKSSLSAEQIQRVSSLPFQRTPTDQEQTSDQLAEGGAIPAYSDSLPTHEKIAVEKITHIITNTIDFPEYAAVADPSSNKYVVKPDWVAASAARGKQASPRQYSPDPKMFFSGLIVSCADLPEGDKDAIIGYVLAVGGLYSSSITRATTHIIALSTESVKCQSAISKNLGCKIVLPHW